VGAEIAEGVLHADDAAPAVQRLVLQLQARIVAAVLEGGADFAAFDFLVLVVGQPAAEAHFLKAGERLAILGAQVDPVAAQLHIRHAAVLMLVIVPVAVLIAVLVFAMIVAVMPAAMQVRAVRVATLVFMIVAG